MSFILVRNTNNMADSRGPPAGLFSSLDAFCLMWGWLPLLCKKRRQTAEKAGETLPLASICSSLMGHQDSGGTGSEHLASSSSLIRTNLSRQEDPLKMPQCLKDAETLFHALEWTSTMPLQQLPARLVDLVSLSPSLQS